MTHSPSPILLYRLVLCLQWLAAEPEKTLAATFPAIVPNELGNDLDTAFEQAKAAGALTDEARRAVEPILALMDLWSGAAHADFWTPEAVRRSPVWSDLREMARAALIVFGAPRRDDDLRDWV